MIPPEDVPLSAGTMPARRLNREEYANTIRDLLGETLQSGEDFTTEKSSGGLAEGGPLSTAELDRMLATVAGLSSRYMNKRFDGDSPCKPKDDNDRACAQAFVAKLAGRAYRRPATPTEINELMQVYDDARVDRSLRLALVETISAALLSPRFNYRWELGEADPHVVGAWVALGPYELASRLSYFLWQSMPDPQLFAQAATGALREPAVLMDEARRLLKDPERGPRGVRSVFRTWLPLGKLLSSPGGSDPASLEKLAILESLYRFVDDLVLGGGDGRYATLLSADYAFVDDKTAALLGVPGMATAAPMARTPLADGTRAGIFTQPAFLAATADSTLATIIHRGRFVFERLGNCTAVPPLTGAIPDPPVRDPNASVRQHLSAHADNGACRSCHQYMDPMGFAFDKFDARGKLRTTDDYGKPVDTSGTMPLTAEVTLTFHDAADLLRQLAQRPESARCFSRQISGFALRAGQGAGNEPSLEWLADGFVNTGGDIATLLVSAAGSPAFSHRKPSDGELLP